MSVHLVIEIKVLNKEIYAQYVKRVPAVVKSFGARYIARGGKITTLKGDWHPERIIILEFDNKEQVDKWFNSPEYAELNALRENSTITNAVVIESEVLP